MAKKKQFRNIPEAVKAEEVAEEVTSEEMKEAMEEVAEPVEEKKESVWMAKIINVDILNIRQHPNCDVISQLSKGTELKLISKTLFTDEKGVDWYNVITPFGQEGWAMAQFLDVFEEGTVKEV